MDETMIERVARAIHEAYWADEWEGLDRNSLQRDMALNQARAAIRALREPTSEMTTAAALADHDGYDTDAAGVYAEIWGAMISVALSGAE